MVSGKNRIGQVLKVSTATLTLVPLSRTLSVILVPLDDGWTVTLGAADTRLPAPLTHGFIAVGVVHQRR